MQEFWFGVIAVLWAGFFVLEGFDFGVGNLLPIVGKTDEQRKIALRSIGPVWDGNEVWLLTAGGATFAAFPAWYASAFSGFYLAFALLLVGLILRGIGIEYRGKAQTDAGRRWADFAVILGSFLPSLLLGVAFANFMRGVSLDGPHGDMNSTFWSLLNPYALIGGITTLLLFTYHGAVYLMLRTTGDVRENTRRLLPGLSVATAAFAVVFLALTAGIKHRGGWVELVLAALIVVTFVASALWAITGKDGRAFTLSAVTTLLVPIWVFSVLYPYLLPARNNLSWSLTVTADSSSNTTLKVMTVVALVMTPIVLIYQAWSYWVFRARVTGTDVAGDGYGGGPVGPIIEKARESAKEMLGHGSDKAGSGAPAAP